MKQIFTDLTSNSGTWSCCWSYFSKPWRSSGPPRKLLIYIWPTRSSTPGIHVSNVQLASIIFCASITVPSYLKITLSIPLLNKNKSAGSCCWRHKCSCRPINSLNEFSHLSGTTCIYHAWRVAFCCWGTCRWRKIPFHVTSSKLGKHISLHGQYIHYCSDSWWLLYEPWGSTNSLWYYNWINGNRTDIFFCVFECLVKQVILWTSCI